jgi:hypothetical protein
LKRYAAFCWATGIRVDTTASVDATALGIENTENTKIPSSRPMAPKHVRPFIDNRSGQASDPMFIL